MNGVSIKKIAAFLSLLLLSILLMQFVWRIAEPAKKEVALPAEKVNLALRRTADALLRETGDSTSRIPPVEQITPLIWLVRLQHTFNYDGLPALLQSSFDVYGIARNYDVAVLRCEDGTLQVGYNFQDFSQNNAAPCRGRELPADCYNLQLTFSAGDEKPSRLPLTGWLLSGLTSIALYFLGRKWLQMPEKAITVLPAEVPGLHFGQSHLDVANLQLVCGNMCHALTYREAKLLNLFAERPNQVLERCFILENVWADEGILVGRSVDMFVSRLRKMLRDDPSVQLVAVHGVGYRMEVG